MTVFAVTPTPAWQTDLLLIITGAFCAYVAISFFCVARYTLKQIRTGHLIDHENVPPRFAVTGVAGWFFIICVLELIFLQSVFYVILVGVGTAGLLVESGRTANEQFGLSRLKPARVLSWGLLVLGAVMLVEIPLSSGVSWIFDQAHLPHPEQQTVETFRQFDQPSAILGFIFQAVFLFPLVEELFFRGFLLTFLKNYTSTWLALVLSAGVFAFAHVNLGAVIPLWFLGIVLGVAYEHTGSLLLPIGIHACWNLITALSLLLDKGSS